MFFRVPPAPSICQVTVLYPINKRQANQVLQMFAVGPLGVLCLSLSHHACLSREHVREATKPILVDSVQLIVSLVRGGCLEITSFPPPTASPSQSISSGKGRTGLFQFRQWTHQNCLPLPSSFPGGPNLFHAF